MDQTLDARSSYLVHTPATLWTEGSIAGNDCRAGTIAPTEPGRVSGTRT